MTGYHFVSIGFRRWYPQNETKETRKLASKWKWLLRVAHKTNAAIKKNRHSKYPCACIFDVWTAL